MLAWRTLTGKCPQERHPWGSEGNGLGQGTQLDCGTGVRCAPPAPEWCHIGFSTGLGCILAAQVALAGESHTTGPIHCPQSCHHGYSIWVASDEARWLQPSEQGPVGLASRAAWALSLEGAPRRKQAPHTWHTPPCSFPRPACQGRSGLSPCRPLTNPQGHRPLFTHPRASGRSPYMPNGWLDTIQLTVPCMSPHPCLSGPARVRLQLSGRSLHLLPS